MNASATGGTISNLKLSVNGVLMHQENSVPYDWSSTSDAALADLSAGLYDLSVTATASDGNTGTATRQIAVGLADGSGLVLTELGPLVEHFTVRATAPGAYSAQAAGTDIWGITDQGGIVSKPLAGDVVAVVKLESLVNIDPFSKARSHLSRPHRPGRGKRRARSHRSQWLEISNSPDERRRFHQHRGHWDQRAGVAAPEPPGQRVYGSLFHQRHELDKRGNENRHSGGDRPGGPCGHLAQRRSKHDGPFSGLHLDPSNSLAGWRKLTFRPLDLDNPAISGDAADPEGDGLTNAGEFFADLSPYLADAASAAPNLATVDAAKFGLRFRQRKDLGGATRVFQQSTDLVLWTDLIPGSVEMVQDFGNSACFEARFPLTGAARFFRVTYRF